ncbi:protein decapping 5-like [Solanum pennellii]|uniref:Protein decapping 5-like n=1 Tax=Solanum pennellii TaxID=28526 RepID=A0ABM1GD42_SOLPN|nr:protein decapping 5-like [Solanum pennellii]
MAAPPIGIHQRLALARTGELRLGSLISVISTSEMRYEGILFEISNHRLGLKYVKFFGSEGRLKYGPQIPGKDRIYNYIYLRGANIKDLQVISPPLPSTTSVVPGHPAIIRPRFGHPTPTHMAFTSHGANVRSSARPILRPVTSFRSASTSSFRGSFLPPPPANISRTRPNYWPGLIGSSRGVAYFHPPPSQAPVQQHQNVNTSLVGGSSYYEHQHPLLLGHSTSRCPTTNPSLLSGGQVTFSLPQAQQSGQRQKVNIEEMTVIAPVMEPLPSNSSEETLEKPTTETGSTSSPHDKNQSAGGRDQKPGVIRRFVEDFDFEGMYKKFNKKEVWAIFSNNDDHKLPVYHKDDFFDYLSYGLPEHESILTLSQQMKIDNETFGVEIPIVHMDHGNRPHSSRTSQPSLGGRGYGNVRGGPGKKVWRRVSK